METAHALAPMSLLPDLADIVLQYSSYKNTRNQLLFTNNQLASG